MTGKVLIILARLSLGRPCQDMALFALSPTVLFPFLSRSVATAKQDDCSCICLRVLASKIWCWSVSVALSMQNDKDMRFAKCVSQERSARQWPRPAGDA